FFFQAEDGIRDFHVTGVQTCALPISINVFRSLGVLIEIVKAGPEDEGLLKIESPGIDGWKSPRDTVDYGNSGTTARLLMGVFARSEERRVGKEWSARGSRDD